MTEPCNKASKEFLKQLDEIEPSISGAQEHRPCTLVLIDGTVVERAICVEDHRGFRTDSWIHPDQVAKILPSNKRTPAKLATKLYKAGESGMGYQVFKMKIGFHKKLVYVIGGVCDFLDLPEGVTTKEIKNVYPHEGRKESKSGYRQAAEFKWCYYTK